MTNAKIIELTDRWTRENNAGHGYAPYTDVAGDDTVSAAIEAAEADGWTHVSNSAVHEVQILVNDDGEAMGIGGDASRRGAWACNLGSVD